MGKKIKLVNVIHNYLLIFQGDHVYTHSLWTSKIIVGIYGPYNSCWLDDIVAPSKSLVVIVQELIEDFSKIIVVFLQELSIEPSIGKTHANEPLHR